MLGIIGFKELRVRCIIGKEPHERKEEQELLVDLKVETDFSKVALSDDLHDTIDYVALADVCRQTAEKGKYFLIEKYASDVLDEVLRQFTLRSAWILVRKPLAIPEAECALVELKRECK